MTQDKSNITLIISCVIMFVSIGVIVFVVYTQIQKSLENQQLFMMTQQQSKKAADERTDQAVNNLTRVIDSVENKVIKILEQQGNISKEARDKITASLIKNEQEVIPKLLNMTTEANEFWSFLRTNFDETYLDNEYRQYAQSNDTAKLLPELIQKLDQLTDNETEGKISGLEKPVVITNGTRPIQ